MRQSASGTFRTSRDVRLESGMRTKADIVKRRDANSASMTLKPSARLPKQMIYPEPIALRSLQQHNYVCVSRFWQAHISPSVCQSHETRT